MKTNKTYNFFITFFLGIIGIHKFIRKKTVQGVIYIFTFGLFGFGWIIDFICALLDLCNDDKEEIEIVKKSLTIAFSILIFIFTFFVLKNDTTYLFSLYSLFVIVSMIYINIIKTETIYNVNIIEISEKNISKIEPNIKLKSIENINLHKDDSQIKKDEEIKLNKYVKYRKNKIYRYEKKNYEILKENYLNFIKDFPSGFSLLLLQLFQNIELLNLEICRRDLTVDLNKVFLNYFNNYLNGKLSDDILKKQIKTDLEVTLPIDVDDEKINLFVDYVFSRISFSSNIILPILSIDGFKLEIDSKIKLYSCTSNENNNSIVNDIAKYYCISKIIILFLDSYQKFYLLDKQSDLYKFINNAVDNYINYETVIQNISDLYKQFFYDKIKENELKIIVSILSLEKMYSNSLKELNYNIRKTVKTKLIGSTDTETFNYKLDYVINGKNIEKIRIFKDISSIIDELCKKNCIDGKFTSNIVPIMKQIYVNSICDKDLNYVYEISKQYSGWYYKFEEKNKYYLDEIKKERIINNDFSNENISNNYLNKFQKLQNGIEFENFLCELFNEFNYDVVHCGKSGDQGGDLVIKKNNIKYVIQAKFYSFILDNTPIQEVYAAKNHYNADKCIVITNNKFSKNAKELAEVNSVILIDGEKLKEIINLLENKSNYYYVDIVKNILQ